MRGLLSKIANFWSKNWTLVKNQLHTQKANKIAHHIQKTVLLDRIFIARNFDLMVLNAEKVQNPLHFQVFQHFELQIKISRNKNAIRQNGFSYLVRNFVGFLGVQFVFFCGQIF